MHVFSYTCKGYHGSLAFRSAFVLRLQFAFYSPNSPRPVPDPRPTVLALVGETNKRPQVIDYMALIRTLLGLYLGYYVVTSVTSRGLACFCRKRREGGWAVAGLARADGTRVGSPASASRDDQ
jgi:hypothetical protein